MLVVAYTPLSILQGVFLLMSGFFRLPNDYPKIFWKYPMFYLGFHMYALQVKKCPRPVMIAMPFIAVHVGMSLPHHEI